MNDILGTEMLLRGSILSILVLQLALGFAKDQKKKKQDEESMRPNPAAATLDTSQLASCPAGSPLGEMSLAVRSANSDRPLSFENIVHLTEGDVVEYAPVEHGHARRDGEVALVLVPTKISGREELIVTDPKDAGKPAKWEIPRSMALTVFVYGPQGLSRKRVKSFLSQDELLIAQLADYADKTAQTEALIATLSNTESSAASVNAALNGFASQYGLSVQLDKNAPPSAQAQALFSAINPQLSSYSSSPITPAARASQTASLATAAAGLFFGSPVGLLAGGTSMLLDLRSIAFPDTQFRSSFALTLKNTDIDLCGQRGNNPPRTRIAYLWASRIPNAPKPEMTIGDANYLPQQQKSPLPVTLADSGWKYLQRARDWSLADASGKKIPVKLVKLQNQKAVELDLTKANVPPGDYKLGGYWDWAQFTAQGDVRVRPLSDLSPAKLSSASQDSLLAHGGKIPVTVTGADFEFASKIEMKKANDEFATPEPVRFLLPKGLRTGPQDRMDVLIDTKDLDPGNYQLLVSQGGETSSSIPFKVLPATPEVENFPVLVNAGAGEQHYALKGERLDQITRLEASGVGLSLDAAASATARALTVKLQANEQAGQKLAVKAYVKDRSEPLVFGNGLEITAPLPAIVSSKLAVPSGLSIALHQNEYPAGVSLSSTIDVRNLDPQSTLQLGCADGVTQPVSLHLGQQTAVASLQQLSSDQLYLLFDTSSLPAGCRLQAAIDNGRAGRSQPYELARITRLPQVNSFEPASTPPSNTDAKIQYTLKGRNLEMIQRAGWDPSSAVDVTALPAPIPGEGQKQMLTIELPPPQTGKDELYLWLRGDKEVRQTTLKPSAPSTPPKS